MRLEQLKYVLEIERCHSMNKASKNLYVTQQNLSYAIKSLEKELGISILDRQGQGSSLTEEGRLFSVFCRRVLEEWDTFQNHLQAYQEAEPPVVLKGDLRLYINKMYETFILPEILGAFMMAYPEVRIKTIPTDMSEGDRIDTEQDFVWLLNLPKTAKAILPTPNNPEMRFDFHTLFTSRSVLCVNRAHPLAENKTVSLKSALQYPLIYHGMMGRQDTPGGSLFETLVTHYGDYPVKLAAQTDSYGIWLDMIASGKGVGIISDFIVEKIRHMYPRQWESVTVVGIKEYMGYATGYAVRKGRLTDVESAFVAFLEKNVS